MICNDFWLNSLPFYRPYLAEDDSLRVEFNYSSKVEWYKQIVKDIWHAEGGEWRGYTAEFFGPKLWQMDNLDEYPYWRIQDDSDPKRVIQLLRTRVCYEPQKQYTPIFLELRYQKFHLTSSIRGMDSDVEVGPEELTYLLRIRNRLFGLESTSSLSLITARRGRRTGSGFFASVDNFLIALQDVLQDADHNLSEPKALERLSRHQLWQSKPLTLEACQKRTKTLRNWLDRSGLNWEKAKDQYCPRDKENK